MREQVEAFRKVMHPDHALELMEEAAVKILLNGFSFALKAGTSLVYSISPSNPTRDSIKYVDVMDQPLLALQVAHPICRTYRSTDPIHNEYCREADKEIVLRYYTGQWDAPRLYRCHMDLWDMTFPLRVDHNLIGVLFGGQIIVSDSDVDWHNALAGLADQVEWSSLRKERSYQVDDVCEALKSRALKEQRDALTRIVREDPDNKNVPLSKLLKRFSDFVEFGEMMQKLLKELYSLKVQSAEQELLNRMAIYLVGGTTTHEKWWQALESVVSAFRDAAKIGPVEVFYGEATRYLQRIGPKGMMPEDTESELPVCLGTVLPFDRLVTLAELDPGERLPEDMPLNADDLLFKSDLALLEGQRISMIFVVRGAAGQRERRRFVDAFCRMLGLRASISEVLLQISSDRDEFAERVRTVSHSTKTPLQLALVHMRRASEAARDSMHDETLEHHLGSARRSVLQAKAEIAEIYPAIGRTRKLVNVGRMVKAVVKEMEPLAAEKRCPVVTRLPAKDMIARLRESEVRLALRNLLDNSIKYSYDDHEIRVTVRPAGSGSVEIAIGNYGVGIPQDRLLAIRREGTRAKVRDPKKPPGSRPGTGLGVPIAVRYLQAEGGTLDISSRATVPGDVLDFHNYLTVATVTLPLVDSHGAPNEPESRQASDSSN